MNIDLDFLLAWYSSLMEICLTLLLEKSSLTPLLDAAWDMVLYSSSSSSLMA